VFLPLVVVAELAYFAVQARFEYVDQRSDLISRTETLAQIQSVVLGGPLWEFDFAELEAAVGEIASLPFVRGVVVRDEINDIVTSSGDLDGDSVGPDFRILEQIFHEDAGMESALGSIEIIINEELLIQSSIDGIITDMIGLSILLIVLIGAAFVAVRLFVSRPLEQFRVAIEGARTGQVTSVKWRTSDEFGDVARAFDNLQIQRAEAALRFHQMSKVFRDGTDPMIIEDLDGTVIDMNRIAEQAYGWSREELIGQPIKTIVPKERYGQAGDLLERCKNGEEVRDIEGLRVNKDGTIVDVLLTLSLLKDDSGNPESVVSIASDISALKAAERQLRDHQENLERDIEQRTAELRERENRFRSIFEASAAGMALLDMQGRYTQVNDRFCAILGYSQEEMLTMTWRDVTYPEDIAKVEALDAEVSRGERTSFVAERRMLRKDGTLIWTNLSSAQLFDDKGDPVNIFSFVQDITDLKLAEQAVRENERNLNLILESSTVGVGVLDQDTGERIFANPQLLKMFGAESEEELFSVDMGMTYVNLMDWEDFQEVVKMGEPIRNLEVMRRRIDGEKIWVLQSMQPIGKFMKRNACVIWLVDITDQKAVEIEMANQKEILDIALDNMDQGLTMYDEDLNLAMRNDRLLSLMDLPSEVVEVGSHISRVFRYNAERGEYGDGDIDQIVAEKVALSGSMEPHRFHREIGNGRTIEIKGQPVPTGGFVTTYTDITEILEAQRGAKLLQEALDSFSDMIILYDKEERVIFTNDRYHEIYPNAPDKSSIRSYTMESLLRRSLDAGQISAPLALHNPEAWLRQSLEARRSPEGGIGETTHSNGKTYIFRYGRTTEGGMILMQTDITDRKRMEEEIRRGAETLQTTIDNIPSGVLMCGSDGKVRLYNELFCTLMSYPEGLIHEGSDVTDAWRFHYRRGDFETDLEEDAHIESMLTIFDSTEPVYYERRLATGMILDMRFSPLPDGGGVWSISDVTKREELLRALTESEERLRNILESSPIAVAISRDDESDDDGLIEFSNARFRSILELDESEIGEAKTSDFFHQSIDRDEHEKLLGEGRSLFDLEATWVSRSGQEISTLMSLNPMLYNDRKSALIWIYDISDLKRAQEEVAEKEALLRLAMENMPGAMQLVDEDLNILSINQKYIEFYGDPDGLLKPGNSMETVLKSEIDRGLLVGEGTPEEILRERLSSYKDDNARDFEDRAADGRYLQLTRSSTPEGYTVSVAVDVTERKEAERVIASAMALINESIQYASRIQQAMLPAKSALDRIFSDHCMIWRPKEGVGGDIVLLRETGPGPLLCVIDCTGHGVPGGFMTVVVASAFDRALTENKNAPPAAILRRVNQLVKSVLGQDREGGESDDGFECALCLLDRSLNELIFAGARFELWEFDPEGEVVVYPGDKTGVGYRGTPNTLVVQEHHIPMDAGGRFFITSDGMIDQVGGERGRSLGKRRLKEMLQRNAALKLSDLREPLLQQFDDYRGEQEQRDDLSLVGFEL